jgi:hypothetical protein
MKSTEKKILFIFFILVSIFLYLRFHDKYYSANSREIIQKYLLGTEDLSKSKKPILWVHVPYEYNSRNWLNFGSRSSWELNQPYLYLTLQSILCKCSESFTIVIIDDDSFQKLIPDWTINMKQIADPILHNMRIYGLMNLLSIYGGMICPISFLCMRNLEDMYISGTANGNMFVCEKINTHLSATYQIFSPDIMFCGAQKESPILSELCHFIRELISTDSTSESIFLGEISTWLKNKQQIQLIDGLKIGIKTIDTTPILIEHLMSNHYLYIDKNTFGIYIPADKILERTNYEWFSRLSEEQIYQSNTIIGKYILISSGECKMGGNTANILEPLYLRPNWVGFWKTPLYPGLYGLKPNFLGDNLIKQSYTTL